MSETEYFDLTQYFFFDFYYEETLSDLFSSSTKADANLNHQEETDFKKIFYMLFTSWEIHKNIIKNNSTHENMIKIQYAATPSSNNFEYSLQFFKIIYRRYPELCKKIFPLVLYIIADSYYEFCRICYKDKEHHLLPSEPLPDDQTKILEIFQKSLSGDNYILYLFSLIKNKSEYHNSSIKTVEKDYKKLTDLCRDMTGINYIYCDAKIKKRLKHELCRIFTNKKTKKKCENLQVFITFLENFNFKNAWSDYDLPLTIYAMNQMTHWFNFICLSSLTRKHNNFTSNISEIITLQNVCTLYNFVNILNKELCLYKEKPDNRKELRQDKASLIGFINIHRQIFIELYKKIIDENAFNEWICLSSKENMLHFKELAEDNYMNLYFDSFSPHNNTESNSLYEEFISDKTSIDSLYEILTHIIYITADDDNLFDH